MKNPLFILTGKTFWLPVLLAVCAVCATAGTEENSPILEYFDEASEIEIIDSEGFAVRELYPGMNIGKGDSIITGASSVEIRLPGSKGIVKIAGKSQFRIDGVEDVHGFTNTELFLASGKIRVIKFPASRSAYTVGTPSALLTVHEPSDFGVSVIEGALESAAILEGAALFAKNTGESIGLEKGRTADIYAPVFLPFTLSAQRKEEFFFDMNFVQLNVEEIARASSAHPTEEEEESESFFSSLLNPRPASAEKDKTASGLTFHLGLRLSMLLVDRKNYGLAAAMPSLEYKGFGAGLYLPLVFPKKDNPWDYDWDFGTNRERHPERSEREKDLARDLSLKLGFLEYGEPGDVFFLRAGSIHNLTLGRGLLVSRYSNDADFPLLPRTGARIGVDGGEAGFDVFLTDIAQPDIFGGRVFIREKFLLAFEAGFSAAADRKPRRDLPAHSAQAGAVDPTLMGISADLSAGLVDTEEASFALFAEGGALIPWLQDTTLFTGPAGSRVYEKGFITEVFYDRSRNEKFANYGISAGIQGNIAALHYTLEYRRSQGIFRHGYFGPLYHRLRSTEIDRLELWLTDPASPEFAVTTTGVYAELGVRLPRKLRIIAGYYAAFEKNRSAYSASSFDTLELELALDKNLIPLPVLENLFASLSYNRQMFAHALRRKDGENFRLIDERTLITAQAGLSLTRNLDLLLGLTTMTRKTPDGRAVYGKSGLPEWDRVVSMETRVRL